jgi:hypothetical protein
MRNIVLAMAMIVMGAAALAAPATAPVEQTIERCKKTPDFCKALIREASSHAAAAKEACVPRDTPPDEVAERVMHTVEDVLEEDPDFRDFSYGALAGQIIALLYPCGVVS